MPSPCARRALLAALALVLGCSSALSPYALDEPEPSPDQAAVPPANPAGPSAAGRAAEPVASLPSDPDNVDVAEPPPATELAPLFPPDGELPRCAIHHPALDCPTAVTVLRTRGRGLSCRRDQLGSFCAYPSEPGQASLLACVVDAALGTRWEFRREPCASRCAGSLSNALAISDADCLQRPILSCQQAAPTDQAAVEGALRTVANECGARRDQTFAVLLANTGCARALLGAISEPSANCIAERVMRLRFDCAPGCATTRATSFESAP